MTKSPASVLRFIYFMCRNILPAGYNVYHRPDEGPGSGTRVTDRYELRMELGSLNLSHLSSPLTR